MGNSSALISDGLNSLSDIFSYSVVAGGVAANSYLRKRVEETFKDKSVLIPRMAYCTDNAAMISIAGYYSYQSNQENDTLELNGNSRLKLS